MIQTHNEILTDDQINAAWGNADFGNDKDMMCRREIIADTLFKYVFGYVSGSTARAICFELGLLGKQVKLIGKNTEAFYLTDRGKVFLCDFTKAMQKIKDRQLTWIPINKNDLPSQPVLATNKDITDFKDKHIGKLGYDAIADEVYLEPDKNYRIYGVTHYFDPSILSFPKL